MKTLFLVTLACALVVSSFAARASAETRRVNDLRRLEYYVEEAANPGDIIEIAPGRYEFEYDRISIQRSGTPEAPIIIRGISDENGNRPVIDAKGVNVHRAVFMIGDGVHDIVVENLEILNAAGRRYPDRIPRYGVNSSAFFLAGCKNVTIRNCNIHHCEDGLFATRWADCILIEDCEIHHNGTLAAEQHNRTHNFYFCSDRQIVRNCYIHDTIEGENFKSRAQNTIFAFNWVDEEAIYSVAVDSGNRQNSLWLGNVVMKRTELGHSQGRLLGVGDGTGVASGKLFAINNTFITVFPRDFHLFTEQSSTCDVFLINNVFAGPGEVFLEHNGKGAVSGRNNWIRAGLRDIPDTLENTISGEDPGFVDAAGVDFRLKPGSPLIDAGVGREALMQYVRQVTGYARSDNGVKPSPIFLKAIEEIEASVPACEPIRKGYGIEPRGDDGKLDIGAYEFVKAVD